jgi:hypothetical protein
MCSNLIKKCRILLSSAKINSNRSFCLMSTKLNPVQVAVKQIQNDPMIPLKHLHDQSVNLDCKPTALTYDKNADIIKILNSTLNQNSSDTSDKHYEENQRKRIRESKDPLRKPSRETLILAKERFLPGVSLKMQLNRKFKKSRLFI